MLDLLLATLVLLAPVPKDKGGFYYPTRAGAICEFDCGEEKTHNQTVTRVEPADRGGFVVTMQVDGREDPQRVLVTDKGLVTLAMGGKRLEPPACFLKLPAVPGETWEAQVRDLTFKYTTVGPERVEVPAGKFDAIRVDMTHEVAGRQVKVSYWYALGVGPVKVVVDGRTAMSLKKFTAGKD